MPSKHDEEPRFDPRLDVLKLSVRELAEQLGFEWRRFAGLKLNRHAQTVWVLLRKESA